MASYAFGESAEHAKDEDAKRLFYTLGAQVFDFEMYQAYKARILESGNVTVTKEDFLFYLTHEKLPLHLQDH